MARKAKRRKRRPRRRRTDYRRWTLAALLKAAKKGTPYLAKCGWLQIFFYTYGTWEKAEESYQKFKHSDDRHDGGVREFLIQKYLKILEKKRAKRAKR
jgi:hypothetical protein